jgi:peptide/nickel transport system substrate-binding protein
MKRNLYALLSLLVLASMVLAACGGGAATEPPADATEPSAPVATEPAATEPAADAPSGIATITFTQEPDSLSPMYTSMWFSSITRQFWLQGLWTFDDANGAVPVLAAEIPSAENGGVSADGKTITIKLREDAKWSDGEPFTANDLVFTYNMILSESNTVNSTYPYADFVASVEAVDDHTAVVTFNEPFAPWLTTIFVSDILPEHVLQPVFDADGTLDNAEWNKAPTVGTGPFMFSEWESGSHLILTANPHWFNQPKLEQIFIRFVPDDAAQEAAIIAGDTDIGVFLSSDQIAKLEATGNVTVPAVSSGYAETWFLNVNPDTAHPAMLDVNVRKAIALATDRFTIVNDLMLESVNPVPATVWVGTPPYNHDGLEPYPYNPEEAKSLLDAAGWVDSNGDGTRDKDGVELVLRYVTTTRELRKNVQAVVQQQWAAVGIGVELRNFTGDIFFGGFAAGGPMAIGDYDIGEYSNAPTGFPDPEISSYWLCSEITSADNPDGGNNQGYCNADLDALLLEQAQTVDLNKRIDLYKQIQQIMYDDVVVVMMWSDPDLWSLNNRLQGVKFSGASPFWNSYEWFVNP